MARLAALARGRAGLIALVAVLAVALSGPRPIASPVASLDSIAFTAAMGEICGHPPGDDPDSTPVHCLACVLAGAALCAVPPVLGRNAARVVRRRSAVRPRRLALVRPRPCPCACGPPRA